MELILALVLLVFLCRIALALLFLPVRILARLLCPCHHFGLFFGHRHHLFF